ncbi:MAG TPA: N-acetyltransferase, partial [Xanthobacteraceae bacterium]
MSDLSLTILPEQAEDDPAIEKLYERTFGPGRFARTAYRLREIAAHRRELSFTARIGTLLVGSVRLTPVRIG